MENTLSYIPVALIVIGAVFVVLYGIDEKLAKHVAIRTVAFIAAVVAVAAILTLHGAARAEEDGVVVEYTPDEYLIEAAGENEILIKVPYEERWLSLYWDTIDEAFKPTKIWVRIVDAEFCVEANYVEEEEPKPIWFPPVFLLGAVAPVVNKNKKNRLVQRLVPDFYMTTERYIPGVPSHMAIELTSLNVYVFVCMEDKTKSLFILPSIEKAISEIDRISKPAFATAFVKAYEQQAVVYSNYKGHLEYWRCSEFSSRINEAFKKLNIQLIPESATHKPVSKEPHIARTPDTKVISDKDDPFVQIIEVKYSDHDNTTFTFRCRQAHTPGDYVCVFTKRADEAHKTYKNVKVVRYAVIKESEVKALANDLGYSDISEVSHDYAVDTEDAWKLWGGSNPCGVGLLVRKPASGVLTEEEMIKATVAVNGMKFVVFPPSYPRDF